MEVQWLMSVFKYERTGWLQIPTKKRGAEKTSGGENQLMQGKAGWGWTPWAWSSWKVQMTVTTQETGGGAWCLEEGPSWLCGQSPNWRQQTLRDRPQRRTSSRSGSRDRRADEWTTRGPWQTQSRSRKWNCNERWPISSNHRRRRKWYFRVNVGVEDNWPPCDQLRTNYLVTWWNWKSATGCWEANEQLGEPVRVQPWRRSDGKGGERLAGRVPGMGWFSLERDLNIQAEIKDPGEGTMGVLESSLLGPRFGRNGIKDTGKGSALLWEWYKEGIF